MSRGGTGRPGGYTLIELLVVMAILGSLAMLVMPLAEMNVQRERERELKRALWQLRDAIDSYHAATAAYPPSLEALTTRIPDLRNPGRVVQPLRRVPRDPFADPALPDHKTWALRSFLSEADRPQPGADVYDVASMSQGVGLNGIPRRSW